MDDLLQQFAIGGAARPDSLTGMQPAFHSALAKMFASAPPDVQQGLKIYSGYRSPEHQAELYQAALRKYGSPEAARKWVAPPGHSNHNKGYASDLKYASPAALQWAHANAAKYGLAFPLANENWHVELAGIRGGHQPQMAAPQTVAQAQQAGFDPVADVMNAAGHQPGPTQPMAQTQGQMAAMYDPLADQQPTLPPDASLGSLAMLFAQQQQNRKKQREDEAQAEAVKRAALFAPGPNGIGGLYG